MVPVLKHPASAVHLAWEQENSTTYRAAQVPPSKSAQRLACTQASSAGKQKLKQKVEKDIGVAAHVVWQPSASFRGVDTQQLVLLLVLLLLPFVVAVVVAVVVLVAVAAVAVAVAVGVTVAVVVSLCYL